MPTVEKSTEINVSAHAAYDQWTQFEDFPKFMEGVKEVRQLDDTHVHWHAEVGGREKEWDAEITEQIPDRRIAWHSVSGAQNDGIVTFDDIGANAARVTLRMNYETQGLAESLGQAAGVLDRVVEDDLQRFKEFLEARGEPTGAWRGQVEQGRSQPQP